MAHLKLRTHVREPYRVAQITPTSCEKAAHLPNWAPVKINQKKLMKLENFYTMHNSNKRSTFSVNNFIIDFRPPISFSKFVGAINIGPRLQT